MTQITDDMLICNLPCLGMMRNALRRAGYETAGELRAASDADLMLKPGIGRGTVNKIRLHLGRIGASAWQPIETAPRDGTVILLVHTMNVLCGYATPMRQKKTTAIGYFETHWVVGVPGGHYHGGGDSNFSHWQRLPPPPS